ncbi:MAG TPA: zinc ribbon domain-containing protein [Gemmatimonadales bacterium]|jgi:tetratricopeptide (TPR) repeat protein|nr:zinc ribbon domain-containing protein [Gemmatimonadales bacterium]
MHCQACGAPLAAGARYCHKCGANTGTAAAAGWRAGVPWAVAGAAAGALITVVALRLGGRSEGAGPMTSAAPLETDAAPAAAPGQPPDISQMSPLERATRLYNRVMSLHAAGQADSAAFFLPMALRAYAMLPELDVDSRYHLGNLDLTAGDVAGALAQADSIARANPSHLFGYMLRARALELQRDTAGARRAYRDFLRREAQERARKRPEYADHAQNLDAFHTQAVEATGAQRAN